MEEQLNSDDSKSPPANLRRIPNIEYPINQANPAAAAATINPAATKTQFCNSIRHPYRPNPIAHHRRRCFNCRRYFYITCATSDNTTHSTTQVNLGSHRRAPFL
ncbi:Uncharacterized protein Fot_11028 [Forsythia ovata]|uniref:Uncharacterized protein n=1 Tax=Forsythia ovata TaxID=205694 RepID=A0ABD1WLD1_9LAMI